MADEELEVGSEGSEASEEAEVLHGGPGDETDSVVHPSDEDRAASERAAPKEEGAIEREAAPTRKFKSIEEAEAEVEKWKKSHLEATRKISELGQEASRYRKLFSEGGRTTEQPPPQKRLAVWEREKAEFEEKRKLILMPEGRDQKSVENYNSAVTDLYFQTHEKYSGIAMEEKAAAKQTSDRMQGWISTEAAKLGFGDEEFDMRNEDGTVEKGSLSNVFWSVARNPESFGINIRDSQGRYLPLSKQVETIAKGINRFLDSYVAFRQNQARKAARETSELTVLRRGSSGPSRKGGEEEEESIQTFAEGLKANMKGRKRVGDLRRRGGD